VAKVALLVGVSEYEPGLNPLPAAVKDLYAMQEILLHPEIGGFAASDITLLKNPHRQAMEESIEILFSNRHKDDLLLLFFSGHGIKDDTGRLYLSTSQTRKTPQGDLVRSSAVAANFVHENMSRSRSKRQVIILDSCFSGAFAEGLSAKDDGTIDIRTQLGGEGRAILTSSSSTQYSFEQEGEELSLYTRFLIEGMKTGAADTDGDDVISIDELHEYASRKVREVKPEMRPEIYAVREGFKIRLSKVPQGDPLQKYQKEVASCGKRGELTIVSRSILDTWRVKLGLSVDTAKALEDDVLEPYRREFQQKLQQYQQVVLNILQAGNTIDDSTRQELQNLQQVLELRNEDTIPIEARVAAYLKNRKQNLKTYQESFSEALRQEYPYSESTRLRLQQMRQQLELNDADVAPLESQITAEVETYRQNLQQYEKVFLAATQQEYPLSEIRRNELRRQQQHLGLTDVEIAPIEAKVTTQVETYQQKLQKYEEAFTNATQRKHQPNEATWTQLQNTWQTLGLNEIDVKKVESSIVFQIETYQINLRQYEQQFADATEQEYPLRDVTRSKLQQSQQALNLDDKDVAPIENLITTSTEEHLQKIQQYEQVFADSIKFEYPIRESTRDELRRLQQVLELRDEEIAQIEEVASNQCENESISIPETKIQQNTSQDKNTEDFFERENVLKKYNLGFTKSATKKERYYHRNQWIIGTVAVSFLIILGKSFLTNNERLLNQGESSVPIATPIAQDSTAKSKFSHTQLVSSLTFSSNGKILASGSWDSNVKVWNLLNGELIYNLPASSWSVQSVAISPDSKTLANGNGYGPNIENETLKIWNLETGKLIRSISVSAKIRAVAFSSDGKIIISGCEDNTIKLFNSNDGKLMQTLSGHTGIVTSVAVSSDGKNLVSGSLDKTVKLWNLKTGELIRTFSGHAGGILSVAMNHDNKLIVSGGSDRTIKAWDLMTGKLVRTFSGHSSTVTSVAISYDGQSLISGSDSSDRSIKVWNLNTGESIHTLIGDTDEVTAIAVTSDSNIFASGGRDAKVKIWNLNTGKLLSTF
jgi:WD40 repeat protein